MGKNHIEDPPNLKKYGVPFYSVAWIPQYVIKSRQTQTADESAAAIETSAPANEAEAETKPATKELAGGSYLVFAGGGGEGRSGIPNSVLLAHFDVASNSLSDQPVYNTFFMLLVRFRNSYEI